MSMVNIRIGFLISFSLILMLLPGLTRADNAVDLGITCWHQHDTIYAEKDLDIDIYFENDVRLGAMTIGLRFFSSDGITWQWHNNYPPYNSWDYYSYVPDSRMPGPEIWDMAMGVPTIYDGDGISPDTISFGGTAMTQGLMPGPLEHMLSYHLTVSIPDNVNVYEFCIDSAFIPPAGPFVFRDMSGNALPTATLWETGGACWPVVAFPYVCGDVNGDGQFNVGDPIYLINNIFKSGPGPENPYLADVNGDGTVDTGDVVYMLNIIFASGSDPVCP